MSNITPQAKALNQGLWKQLEDLERKLLSEYEEVYVITGPLYEKKMPGLPHADEPHILPSGYWKVIYAEPKKAQIKIGAFIFEQGTSRKGTFFEHLTTIDEVETLSHLT